MLRAAAANRLINTPALPIPLGGGSFSSGHAAVRVESDLEVNVLCLHEDLSTVVIISVDLLYATHALRQRVVDGLVPLGVPGSHIFIAASHTHYAPAIDDTKPLLGEPNPQYLQFVADQTIDAAKDCLKQSTQEVQLTVRQSDVRIGINRRLRRLVRVGRHGLEWNRVGMGPNPTGSTDPKVTVVEVAAGNDVLAYGWSAACHPTGLPAPSVISADWPGRVRERLRDRHLPVGPGQGPPVLFLQGFSGDVRPPSGRVRTTSRQLARRARLGRTFHPMSWEEYQEWTDRVASDITSILAQPVDRTIESGLSARRFEHPASLFAEGADDLPPVSFHRVSVGDMDLVGASAEVVSPYAERVRALAPSRTVVPVGCIDHVIGYWPTAGMFAEGGYEVEHHCPAFGISGCRREVEDRAMQGFRELLARAGHRS